MIVEKNACLFEKMPYDLLGITRNYLSPMIKADPELKPQVVIHRMSPPEAEPLSHLFEHVVMALPYYNDFAKQSELAKYSAAGLRESVSEDPDSVLVARVGPDLVGFCLSRYDDGLVWLSWFGVEKEHRNKGIGSALLDSLEETVRHGRSHKIWCDCRTENEASKAVLTCHGYTQICVVRNHWYGQDFILWEKVVS
jgi:RimJ/RimL family protein N-acetyltransferase